MGLDEKEFAFFEVVKKYILEDSEGAEVKGNKVKEESETYISQDIIELSKEIAKDIAQIIQENYAVDWVTNNSKTSDVERAIFMTLNKKYFKQIKLDARKQMVQPLLNLAKKHFSVI